MVTIWKFNPGLDTQLYGTSFLPTSCNSKPMGKNISSHTLLGKVRTHWLSSCSRNRRCCLKLGSFGSLLLYSFMQIPEGIIKTRSVVFVSVSQLRSLEHKCFLNEGFLTASNQRRSRNYSSRNGWLISRGTFFLNASILYKLGQRLQL